MSLTMGTGAIVTLILTNLSSILAFGFKLYRVIKKKENVEEALVGLASTIEQIGAKYEDSKSHASPTKVIQEIKQSVEDKQATMSPGAAEAVTVATTIADPKKPNPTFA